MNHTFVVGRLVTDGFIFSAKLAIVEALLARIRRLVPRLPCDRDMHRKAPTIDACEGISTNEGFQDLRVDKAKAGLPKTPIGVRSRLCTCSCKLLA